MRIMSRREGRVIDWDLELMVGMRVILLTISMALATRDTIDILYPYLLIPMQRCFTYFELQQ